MIQRMSHTTIYVLNQDEALEFYRNKLGFEVRADFSMEGGFRWLTVGTPGQPDMEMILVEPKEGPMFNAESAAKLRELVTAGTFGIGVFETADCQVTFDELTAKGVEFTAPPNDRFLRHGGTGQRQFGKLVQPHSA